jgi:hypothetical protein
MAEPGFRLAWRVATWRPGFANGRRQRPVWCGAALRRVSQVPRLASARSGLGGARCHPRKQGAVLSAPYQSKAKTARAGAYLDNVVQQTAHSRPSMRASAQRIWRAVTRSRRPRLLPTSWSWRAELGGLLRHRSRVQDDGGMPTFADFRLVKPRWGCLRPHVDSGVL